MSEPNLDYPIFLGSEIEQPNPKEAAFHVLPVPYEKTVSMVVVQLLDQAPY